MSHGILFELSVSYCYLDIQDALIISQEQKYRGLYLEVTQTAIVSKLYDSNILTGVSEPEIQ